MIMELTLKDNDFLRQFEIAIDNHLATIEYSLQERKIFLTKIHIPEEITEDDFQNTFIKIVFDNIEERNLRVVPTCPAIAIFIRKNKQYRNLLPVGIKI
ncbi:MAG: GNAT family N-acetyltransferase [Flavobacteriaceae bacterium]